MAAVILTIVLLARVLDAKDPPIYVRDCLNDWREDARCLDQRTDRRADNDPSFRIPDNGEQSRIRFRVEDCFRRFRCNDNPFPSEREERSRNQCFQLAKKRLDRETEACVENNPSWFTPSIPDWNPIDNYPELDLEKWKYTVTRVYNALQNPDRYCPSDVRGSRLDDLRQCVNRGPYDFGRPAPAGLPPYWCRIDAVCWATKVRRDCRRLWEDKVQNAVCECSKRGTAYQVARQQYRDCIRNQNIPTLFGQDPGYDWLDDYRNDYCLNKNNHPCRNERRDEVNRG